MEILFKLKDFWLSYLKIWQGRVYSTYSQVAAVCPDSSMETMQLLLGQFKNFLT